MPLRIRIAACGLGFLLLAPAHLCAHQAVAAARPALPPAAVQIVLPPQIETDKPATLAVLDAEGRLVSGVTVTLSGGRKVTTDSTGRARFVVTSDPGAFLAEAEGEPAGTLVQASSMVLAPQPIHPDEIVVTDYPRVVALDDLIAVRGAGFRGDADINTATLTGQPVLVLASSPASLVLQPGPNTKPGPAELEVQVAGHSTGPLLLTVVSLEIEPPAGRLAIGKKSKYIVRVKGTEQQLALAVRNLTPGTIELAEGNLQRVTTSGGPKNSTPVAMRAIGPGNFNISVRVVPGASGAPDLALVRRELLAAKAVAQGEWIARIDRVLGRMDNLEKDPQGLAHFQNELEQLYSSGPPAEMGRHLQAAWMALLRP
jgi:hypothetical protein